LKERGTFGIHASLVMNQKEGESKRKRGGSFLLVEGERTRKCLINEDIGSNREKKDRKESKARPLRQAGESFPSTMADASIRVIEKMFCQRERARHWKLPARRQSKGKKKSVLVRSLSAQERERKDHLATEKVILRRTRRD